VTARRLLRVNDGFLGYPSILYNGHQSLQWVPVLQTHA